MPPAEWHAKGVRLLGRTAVECTRDRLADAIAEDVARLAAKSRPSPRALVIDPFAGSANTLFWLLRHLSGAAGVGFELNAEVCRLTRMNLAALEIPIEIQNIDYLSGLVGVSVAECELLIVFIAPPWGNALDRASGLDLRRTMPPITEIVDLLLDRFSHNRLLIAIQVHERVFPSSVIEVSARFNSSIQRIYELNVPGQNHGVLLGTKGWTPADS
jgi:hypothetical protein